MKRTAILAAAAFALSACIFLFGIQPAFAQVQADTPVIAPSSVWFDLWQIVQPVVVLLVSTVGPVLVGWISARIIAFLKVSDQNKQLEIEARLRDALHQSAFNALKFALAKGGISSSPTAGAVTWATLSEAANYVQEKNPEALEKLGVDGAALRDIIIAKVPDLLGPSAKMSLTDPHREAVGL